MNLMTKTVAVLHMLWQFTVTKPTKAILHRLLVLLTRILSPQFKRSFLLTTVYTRCVEEQIFAGGDLAQLNQKLNVACDLAAMESMSLLGGRIWKDVALKDLLQSQVSCSLNGECVPQTDANRICRQIADLAPDWLKYDKNEMVKDLAMLFYSEPAKLVAVR